MGEGTLPPEPTPAPWEDPREDDDLTLVGLRPADGVEGLPGAITLVAEFSEPFLGKEADIWGKIGPDCGAGAPLIPQLAADKTSVSWNMVLERDTEYCFSLTMKTGERSSVVETATWTTAPCGVTFQAGGGGGFLDVGGDSELTAEVNSALEGMDFPLLMALPRVERAATFPTSPRASFGRLFQVYSIDPGEDAESTDDDNLIATGQGSADPFEGSITLEDDCLIGEGGALSCEADVLPLYVGQGAGKILEDGRILTEGSAFSLTVADVEISGEVATSGDVSSIQGFQIVGEVADEDLSALAEWTGSEELQDALARRGRWVAPSSGRSPAGGVTVVFGASPWWIPMAGCDPTVY